MPSPYDIALQNPLDAAKMQAAADLLRRREIMATVGQLTGDPVLGEFARGATQRISGRRRGLQEAQQRAQQAQAVRPSGMPGYVIRGGQLEQVPGYHERIAAEKQKDREYRLRAAMQRRQDDQEFYRRELFKRTLPTPSQAASARETLSYLPELQSLAEELRGDEVDIGPWTETAGEAARELGPLGVSVAGGLERMGFNPPTMRWLERGRQAESDIMRLMSGLAITAPELKNIKRWSPWAPNLSKQQRVDRIQNIYNKLGREASGIMGTPWERAQFDPVEAEAAAERIEARERATEAAPAMERPPGLTDRQWQALQVLEAQGGQ